MAYLDFRQSELATGAGFMPFVRPEPTTKPAETGFSALEWLVIALARRDHLGSLREPGRIGSALSRIFGGRGESRLANPRLEALRRVAVLAWHHGYNVPRSELAALFATGFSQDQAELLIDNVIGRRAARRSEKIV